MNFKENEFFMNKIRENDIIAIKSELEGFISFFNGNKGLCDEAIEYALKNSSFKWEDEDGRKTQAKFITASDKYDYEKGRLVRNFTKERYEKVLELYKEYVIERDKLNTINKVEEEKNELKNSTENKKYSQDSYTNNRDENASNGAYYKKENNSNRTENESFKNKRRKQSEKEDSELLVKRVIAGAVVVGIIALVSWIID